MHPPEDNERRIEKIEERQAVTDNRQEQRQRQDAVVLLSINAELVNIRQAAKGTIDKIERLAESVAQRAEQERKARELLQTEAHIERKEYHQRVEDRLTRTEEADRKEREQRQKEVDAQYRLLELRLQELRIAMEAADRAAAAAIEAGDKATANQMMDYRLWLAIVSMICGTTLIILILLILRQLFGGAA